MLRRMTMALGPFVAFLSITAMQWFVVAGPARADEASDAHAAAELAEGPHGEASHGGDAHGEPDILAAQPPLAIYTLIVFLLLLAVLYRFAWGPLSRALHDREHSLEAAFKEAEAARAEAAALLEQHRKQMEQVQDQVRQIMDEANRKAESVYQERLGQAKADAEATAQRATREIAAAKEQAVAELYARSADLAVAVAGQVLKREIGEDEHRRLIDLASQELQAVGDDGRGGLA